MRAAGVRVLGRQSVWVDGGEDIEGCIWRGHDERFDGERVECEMRMGVGDVANGEACWGASGWVAGAEEGVWVGSRAVVVFGGDEVARYFRRLALRWDCEVSCFFKTEIDPIGAWST